MAEYNPIYSNILKLILSREYTEAVDYLISVGADPNQLNNEGYGILHEACSVDYIEIGSYLKLGANPNLANSKGITPLMVACSSMRIDAIKTLVKQGANVNALDSKGRNALSYFDNNIDAEPSFFKSDSDNDDNDNDSYYSSESSSNVDNVNALRFKTVSFLIRNKLDVNSIDHDGTNILHTLCKFSDDVKTARLLIDHKIDVNLADKNGYTPLHLAIRFYNNKLAKLLIPLSTNLNSVSYEGNYTPLTLGLAKGIQSDVIMMLIDSGANVKIADHKQKSPLHHSVKYQDNIEIPQKLIEAGADLNAVDHLGRTPLMRASYMNRFHHAELLLKSGASLFIEDNEGKSLINSDKYLPNRHNTTLRGITKMKKLIEPSNIDPLLSKGCYC